VEESSGVLVSEPEEANGNGPRATVALVDSKLDTVRAIIEGGFTNVQRQLDEHAETVKALPVAVTALSDRVFRVEMRQTDIERELEKRAKEVEDAATAREQERVTAATELRKAAVDSRAWWRTYTAKDVPFFLLSLAGFLLAITH
jgi:chromosome segregation ATPase